MKELWNEIHPAHKLMLSANWFGTLVVVASLFIFNLNKMTVEQFQLFLIFTLFMTLGIPILAGYLSFKKNH